MRVIIDCQVCEPAHGAYEFNPSLPIARNQSVTSISGVPSRAWVLQWRVVLTTRCDLNH